LRDLTRTRTTLTRDLSREISRLEDTLEDTGIKLSAVISDLNGVSGRRMLRALVDGERDPQVLADLGDRRLKASKQQLVDALTGRFTDHHAFMVGLHAERIEDITSMIARLDERIEEAMSPFRERAALLMTVPGVSTRAAQVIIAETGGDMSVFATPGHLVSWAGAAPGHHQSAGRSRSVRTRPGNNYLRGALGTTVMSISGSRTTRLAARYRRIAARRGPLRANVAVQNTILTTVWHMLTNNEPYTDLGPDFYTNRARDRNIKKAIRTLEADGYTVIPAAA
jgi:transposase